jgi:hypothetical protein
MTFTERFLKAKHWQLFILTFGLPMVIQFIMMITIFAKIATRRPPDPSAFLEFYTLFPLLMIICAGTYYGWFWSIAIGLQDKIPANVKMKTGKFKIFFFFPLTYMLVIAIGMGIFMTSIPTTIESGAEPNVGIILSAMGIIVPLHLFSMFCIFYCLYFVSKTFKTVELQRETTFVDFAGEFFLIWFYPIGVWVVQPKINKMVSSTTTLTS